MIQLSVAEASQGLSCPQASLRHGGGEGVSGGRSSPCHRPQRPPSLPVTLPSFPGGPGVTAKLRSGCTIRPSPSTEQPGARRLPSPEETGKSLGSCTFPRGKGLFPFPVFLLLLPGPGVAGAGCRARSFSTFAVNSIVCGDTDPPPFPAGVAQHRPCPPLRHGCAKRSVSTRG